METIIAIVGTIIGVMGAIASGIVWLAKGTQKVQINDNTHSLRLEEVNASMEGNSKRLDFVEEKITVLSTKIAVIENEMRNIDKHLEANNKQLERNAVLFERILIVLNNSLNNKGG